MRKVSIKLTIFLLSGLIGFWSSAQEQNEQRPLQEKVYVQLDRPFYQPDDVVRFNLTVLDAQYHLPSSISDIVYAELISPKGSLIKKLKLPIEGGTAKGDFDLPETGGMYSLRAYTSWSRNFKDIQPLERIIPVQNVITTRLLIKPDFEKENYGPGDTAVFNLEVRDLKDEPAGSALVVYSLRIAGKETESGQVVTGSSGLGVVVCPLPPTLQTTDVLITAVVKHQGIEESISRSVPIVLNHIKLKFYPEGGHLVNGETCVVAFEALNEYGKGADVRGVITNDLGEIVSRFESFHEGMGVIPLTPQEGRTYIAKIITPQLKEQFHLPETKSLPVINLTNRSDRHLSFGVQAGSDDYQVKGFNRGELIFERSLDGSTSFKVSTDSLPVGISRFVLYNSHGLPTSERSIFVNRDQTIRVEMHTEEDQYSPGVPVNLKISTMDANGDPVSTKLGISVVDDQLISFADDRSDNILSYFYLSSELKGDISDPGFYFDPEEEKAQRALDMLMLTRGWAQYTWKQLESADSVIFPPEKIRVVTGTLKNKRGNSVQGSVYALERSEEQRMLEVETTDEGQFLIRNFNATSELYLFTKRPNQLEVNDDRAITPVITHDRYHYWQDDLDILEELFIEIPDEPTTPAEEFDQESFEGTFDVSLDEDVSSLEEVVVVGYGTQRSRDLTGSVAVVHINSHKIEYFSSMDALHGKAPGVTVTSKNAGTPASSPISFSRAKSMAGGNGSPLVVLDGFVLSPSISRHFLHTDQITPDQVDHITYMDSPEARLQYGGKAANGVLFIERRSTVSRPYHYQYATRKGKYNGVVITAPKFSLVREAYSISERNGSETVRKNLDHLVYWNPEVITDEEGTAEISFLSNDLPSNFRIVAEGFSSKGILGRGEETYASLRPVSIDLKLPNQIGYEDTISANVIITNETEDQLEGSLDVHSNAFEIDFDKIVSLEPGTRKSIAVSIIPKGMMGTHQIDFSFKSGAFTDLLQRTLEINPVGYPTTISHSGSNPNGTFSFNLTNAESGSVKTQLVVYPNVVNDLEGAAKSLFREPHGCFEQVSATLYPSILALHYMKSIGIGLDYWPVERKALEHITSGYKQLIAYEIEGGGFEWFGHKPAHEGLTAFGLLEFHQMKDVHSGVDEVIQRSVDWLLSRKDQQGGFNQNRGKYGFSAASKEVNNAYIVYALSEIGEHNVSAEYEQSLAEADQSKDLYQMALMVNAAYNLGDKETYNRLIKYFEKECRANEIKDLKASHSVVRSYGYNLNIELVALWSLAVLKEENLDISFITGLIDYLLENRTGARFGSTQATALALQAITTYNLRLTSKAAPGTIEVLVNGSKANELNYTSGQSEPLICPDFSSYLRNGENRITLKFPHKEDNLPFFMSVEWSDKTPVTNKNGPIQLELQLNRSSMKVNETVRLTSTIINTRKEGVPMSIARIGIPGGLSLQTWQLKELLEKRVFDFYEIINDDLVLYFKEMGPEQMVQVHLDLKAEVLGRYLGRASSAYLYYQDDQKSWAPGLNVNIEK